MRAQYKPTMKGHWNGKIQNSKFLLGHVNNIFSSPKCTHRLCCSMKTLYFWCAKYILPTLTSIKDDVLVVLRTYTSLTLEASEHAKASKSPDACKETICGNEVTFTLLCVCGIPACTHPAVVTLCATGSGQACNVAKGFPVNKLCRKWSLAKAGLSLAGELLSQPYMHYYPIRRKCNKDSEIK